MDNVELLRTIGEMCNSTKCQKCMEQYGMNKCMISVKNMINNPENIVNSLEQWRKEHPIKTYADVFFEQFPNADYTNYNSTKIPNIAFKHLYGGNYIDMETDVELWLQPYPEDKK